jgi:hypothetical protein
MSQAIVKKILNEENHIIFLEMNNGRPNVGWSYGIVFDQKLWFEIYDTFETMNTNDILTVFATIIPNNNTYINFGIPPNASVCCVESIVGIKRPRKK